MRTTQYFKTDNGNCYLYSPAQGYFAPISSVFYEILQNKFYIQNKEQSENIFTKDNIGYYKKKINYLKQHGFFENNEISVTKKLSKKDIEIALSNMKQLTIEVTEKCNLKCTYCIYGEYYEKVDRRERKDIEFDKIKHIINFLIPFWNSNLNNSNKGIMYISFYGGEPLLKIGLIKKTVEFIRSINVNKTFIFSLTTNGLLLHKYINYLVNNNFHILISLDGNKSNNSYRILHNDKESFTSVVNNLAELIEKYPEFFRTNVNFNSVLHNRNNIEDIYVFFKKKYNKIPRIAPLSTAGVSTDKIDEFIKIYRNVNEIKLANIEDFSHIKKDIFLNLPSFNDLGIFLKQSNTFYFNNISELFKDRNGVKIFPTGTCLPFSKKLFLTAKGLILPCERISHKYALGEISHEGIINFDFNQIVKKYNLYYSNIEKQCSKCYFASMCKQCMFMIDKIENTPKCPGFINRKNFKKYLQKLITLAENNPSESHKLMFETIFDR